MPALTSRPQKITFAELRSEGVRGLLVFCQDYRCGHNIRMNGDRWPDDIRLWTSRTGSFARHAASEVPTSGVILIGTSRAC